MTRATPTTAYTTRHFRRDLLERCRVVAAIERLTIEQVVNRAVEAGLERLWPRRRKRA